MCKTNSTVTNFVVQHNQPVYVSISPCSWMNKKYGLQIRLSLQPNAVNAASIFDLNKSINATTIKLEELVKCAAAQAQRWLDANGIDPIKKAAKAWQAANEARERAMEAENKIHAKREVARLKDKQAKGFTHRLSAWVHPEDGSDYHVEAFKKGPVPFSFINKVLEKSVIKDDYCITVLVDDIKTNEAMV